MPVSHGSSSVKRRVVAGPKSASLSHVEPPASRTPLVDYEDRVDPEILAAAEAMETRREPPRRPVYLITSDRNDPLKRTTRELTQLHKPRTDAAERKPRDPVREMIENCRDHTEHFNAMIRKIERRDKRAVLMVMERMRNDRIAMDATTYNLLLERVVDLRDDIAFEIYEDFKAEAQRDDDATVRPDLRTFELMIRACERNSDYARAFRIYTQMKELFGICADVPLYNTLIGYCAPLRDETTASFIVEEMKDANVEPDVHTYNALMNVFAEAPCEHVLAAYEDMIKRKLRPNRRTLNTLMKACQRVQDYDRVFQFFEEMKHEDIKPDVTTYNILIAACRDRLEYVLGTGKFANVRRTKQQREDGMRAIATLCRSLLEEMDRIGVSPNTFTYNALLSVHSLCRDKTNLFRIFNRMQEDQERQSRVEASPVRMEYINLDHGPPKFSELEALFERAVAAQDRNDAAQAAAGGDASQGDRLGAIGVRATVDTFSTMIEGCTHMQEPAAAFDLFAKMKRQGIAPDRTIYIKLIDVCAVKPDKQQAERLFDECLAQDIPPDVGLYNALLNVFAECCDPAVHEWFTRLKHPTDNLSVKPNQDSYNIMLKAALKTQRMQDAMALYQEMTSPTCLIAPDASSYGLLMDICAACKDVKRASFFIEDMRRRHVAPTVNTYSRFMKVFVAADDKGVVDVFENMKRHGPKPNLEAYSTLLHYYLGTRNDSIYGLFEDMKKDNIDPDLAAFNIMLNYAALTQNLDRTYTYLRQMAPLTPDIDTYNAVMAAFAPSGSDYIFKTFEDMATHNVAPDATTLAILGKYPKGRKALREAAAMNMIRIVGNTIVHAGSSEAPGRNDPIPSPRGGSSS